MKKSLRIPNFRLKSHLADGPHESMRRLKRLKAERRMLDLKIEREKARLLTEVDDWLNAA